MMQKTTQLAITLIIINALTGCSIALTDKLHNQKPTNKEHKLLPKPNKTKGAI
jgi:hypothetical protein